ncbi:hypothetical protein KBD69_03540 [Candidatus Woesebacteria bacterium]|nr:hypothetical protein [Candidatus Woesebacteria bacterium]
MTETLPIAQEWNQYNGELRNTIVSALATKGSPLSAGDVVDGPPTLPLIGLLAESQGEAARYHKLYPDKKLSVVEVMASIRNFSDQVRAAELAGKNALDFHYVDGSSEKLTPRAANARLLGFTIYALDRHLIDREMIEDILKNEDPLEFWKKQVKDHSVDGNEMLNELIIKHPYHPFNIQARQLIPSAESPDIIFEDNPVMQTVLDAHKMHLRLQQARPHGTTLQDLLVTQQATLELVSMYHPLPDEALQINTLAFLGKKTVDDNEFSALSTAITKYMYETKYPALISP